MNQKLATKNYKLITIVGPTASGKSELAVRLALRLGSGQAKKRFGIDGAEIISADSRQVYRGLDIGTGKVPRDKIPKSYILNSKFYYHKGIPHYLLDVASPKRRFTVVQYRKLAIKAINKILKKDRVPILCGGTGFYIQAVVDGIVIPEVPPDWKLRKKLEKKPAKELYQILKKLDPKRAKTIEKKNRRRLIRAIEIAKKIGRVPNLKKEPLPYPVLIIGVKKEKQKLEILIKKRFFKWLKWGFLKEILKLRNPPGGGGLSWQRIEEFGIHYRAAAQYLKKELSKQEFIEKSIIGLQNYAKRQMTWFKRDKRIHWLKNYQEAEKLVTEFLRSKNEAQVR